MQYGYGRGFGLRGASPPAPYFGRGRGGLPRCWYPGLIETRPYTGRVPYWSEQTRDEELGSFKSQLDRIERRIQELEKREPTNKGE